MKLLVIYIAVICGMPVIDARCKRRTVTATAAQGPTCDSPTSPCRTISVQSTNDGLVSYRLCDGNGQGVCDPYQGRLEVLYNNQWGSVYDDLWGNTNANVVCKMFGFTSGASRLSAFYGEAPGSFPIHMDDVLCMGSETSLADCLRAAWGVNNCGHVEDVGVVCSL